MLVVAGIAIGIVVGVAAAVVTIAMLEKSRLGELRRRRTLLITEAERGPSSKATSPKYSPGPITESTASRPLASLT